MLIKRTRIDTFVVWGHGLQYLNNIAAIISKDFKIVCIKKKKIRNMSSFIKKIYNFDYAPLKHLKSKTQYLNSIEKTAVCILVVNDNIKIEYYDEGKFRHSESESIKNKKNEIRGIYNPKTSEGLVSHDHIIHASDNEYQAFDILKTFGVDSRAIKIKNDIGLPYHIEDSDNYMSVSVDIDDVICSLTEFSDNNKVISVLKKIEESPQYHAVSNSCWNEYDQYIKKFVGVGLNDYYSLETFKELAAKFDITKCEPIVVSKLDNGYVILDGLHRAAIQKSLNYKKIRVMYKNG